MRRLLGGILVALAVTHAAPAHADDGVEQVLDTLLPPRTLGPGVTQQDFTMTGAAGQVMGHLVQVELDNPAVSTDLLTAGAVAARAPVARMADERGAVAGINGDFFDLGGTNAAAGPAVAGGRALKAAVPAGRRSAPALPAGTTAEAVFGVGITGAARVDRLVLDAQAVGPRRTVPVVGLNQFAIPVDGVGLFTPEWGTASRAGATCGSNTSATAGCSPATREVVVRAGVVTEVRDNPGAGAIPLGTLVLVGRDAGANALSDLRVGDPVVVSYRLVPEAGSDFRFAVGGTPILRDGAPYAGLDDRVRAPRSAAAVDVGGLRMYLVTVDGRQSDSIGATLSEFATLLDELAADDAVNLDGGGSSTLVYRRPGADRVSVVNDPSDSSPRAVPNGIGVFLTR